MTPLILPITVFRSCRDESFSRGARFSELLLEELGGVVVVLRCIDDPLSVGGDAPSASRAATEASPPAA